MRVFAAAGNPDLATVYMAEMGAGRLLEFVEARQPPYTRLERWILMVSTLFGCPVQCLMCDAGGSYRGKPNVAEILAQIDYMVDHWFRGRRVPATKFKIQFARMGEPAFNMAVLDALEALPARYEAPGLMPSISTIAPRGCEAFFERLLEVKERLYAGGRFQFQYSVHTTDEALRDHLIPARKWSFREMAAYGERFHRDGDRKVTLNFALAAGMPVDAVVLLEYFDPQRYYIKITPVNPTVRARLNGMASQVDPGCPDEHAPVARRLREAGYEVNLSIGETEENRIGSNCGQYVLNYLESGVTVKDGYSYRVESLKMEAES